MIDEGVEFATRWSHAPGRADFDRHPDSRFQGWRPNDADELDPQARRHVRDRVGLFSAFSPQVAKFEGQMKGHPSIHIPLSYFDISIAEFERQLAERVKFHG